MSNAIKNQKEIIIFVRLLYELFIYLNVYETDWEKEA